MKTKLLSIALILFSSLITKAQDRITDISSNFPTEKTHLVTYKDKNYIVSVTPDDIVSYFHIKEDQSLDLVKQKYLRHSYKIRRSNLLVKDNFFILFTQSGITKYNFDLDQEKYIPLNDFYPPSVAFSIDSYDNETARFWLEKYSYIYNYRTDDLFKSENLILKNNKNHVLIRKMCSDTTQYCFSLINSITELEVYIASQPIDTYFNFNLYDKHLLYPDKYGNVIKFYYNGSSDTIIKTTKPFLWGSSAFETESYFVLMASYHKDSTDIEIYNKTDKTLVRKISGNENFRVSKHQIKEISKKVVFLNSERSLFIIDPLTTYINILGNNQFSSSDSLIGFNNNVMINTYYNNQSVFGFVNINTGNSKILVTGSKNQFSYSEGHRLINNNGKYYYSVDPFTLDKHKNLISFYENQSNVPFLNAQNSFDGLVKNSQLLKSEDNIYLLSDDIYQITDIGYQKINQSPLINTTSLGDRKWLINDNNFFYLTDSSGSRIVHYNNGTKRINLNKSIGSTLISRILFTDTHCFVVTRSENKLIAINLVNNAQSDIESNLDITFLLTQLFVFNNHIYYLKSGILNSFNPDTQIKTKHNYVSLPNIQILGELTERVLISTNDGFFVLNKNNQISKLNQAFESIRSTKEFRFSNNNMYIISKGFEKDYLLKYDGTKITKVFEENFLDFLYTQINFNDYIVLSSLDTATYLQSYIAIDPINDKKHLVITKNNVPIDQISYFNGTNLGSFSYNDSFYIVRYNDDFSSYTVIKQIHNPLKSRYKEFVGNISNDRMLISSGDNYLYMDEHFKVHQFDNIIPSSFYTKLLAKDSIFYFIALGTPHGNQVYAFNHEKFNRTLTNTIEPLSYKENFKLYPNPASSYIEFDLGIDKEACVEIYNMYGQLLSNQQYAQNQQLDISHLQNGTYLAKIMQGKQSSSQIFIKQ